ncbi:MAG: ATP-grasp domain-containing protein [Phycisphaeraceae bacterium]|nr:ATP-grasp domain-containing protein [Phycisphaeraceae bacterium]
MNVLILHDRIEDGASVDVADALTQAEVFERCLAADGHGCSRMGVDLDLRAVGARVQEAGLVVNLVESLAGRGSLIHLVPALVESIGTPMTGCPAHAIATTSNKLAAKRVLSAEGVPTPDWVEQHGRVPVKDRWIIKSVWEHASIGLGPDSVVDAGAVDLAKSLVARAPTLGGHAFAERFIEGREFNLALLETGDGVRLLPPAEILFVEFPPDQPRIVDFAAKWDEASHAYHHTPRRFEFPSDDAPLLIELESWARRCWDAFGLRGYARVDFRVDERGRPWVLEVNTNPCLSPDAGFMAAAARGGVSESDVIAHIVRAAR